MAYRDDVATLIYSVGYPLDGDAGDISGLILDGTNSGGIFTGTPLTEDATNSYVTNGTTDRITLPNSIAINNAAQTQKAVCGWFKTTAIQPPPKRIYGEGDQTTNFQFVLAFGNNLVLEVRDSNTDIQIFGPTIVPDRVYHVCAIFLGTSNGNIVKFFVDGVEQTLAVPSNRLPGATTLAARGVGEFGDPVGTVGLGGETVVLNAPVNGEFQHWYFFDGANADLTDTEIRETLFEKGVTFDYSLDSDTEIAMQGDVTSNINNSNRGNNALDIRVDDVTGSGDLTLTATNVVHDPLSSIHIQWMGTGTLTWINDGTSNASIGSTPNGGTINFVNPAQLTLSPLISNSEVRIYEAGTEIELAGIEDSGTSFVSSIQASSIDIVVHKEEYENIRLQAIDMTSGDVSVPVEQIFDRQYENN